MGNIVDELTHLHVLEVAELLDGSGTLSFTAQRLAGGLAAVLRELATRLESGEWYAVKEGVFCGPLRVTSAKRRRHVVHYLHPFNASRTLCGNRAMPGSSPLAADNAQYGGGCPRCEEVRAVNRLPPG